MSLEPHDGSHLAHTDRPPPIKECCAFGDLQVEAPAPRESRPTSRTRHYNPVSSDILNVTSVCLISRALEVSTATDHGTLASGFWLPFHFPTCWNDGDLPHFLMGLEAWVIRALEWQGEHSFDFGVSSIITTIMLKTIVCSSHAVCTTLELHKSLRQNP